MGAAQRQFGLILGGAMPTNEPPPAIVVYDSAVHSAAEVQAMCPHVQARVREALNRSHGRRVVLKQTAPIPGSDAAARRAFIAARHGLRLVSTS